MFTWDLVDLLGSDLLSGTKGSIYEGDPVWNLTAPVSNRSRINTVNPYHSGSDAKRI